MKSTRLLILLFLVLSGHANAQSFLNGSLEAGSTTPCQNIYNHQFTTFMANTGYAFGSIDIGGLKGKLYFYDASCNDGYAQKGSNFLGFAANDAGKVDAVALTLTTPLTANKTYTLSFYFKKPNTMPATHLEIGYTTDSLAFGTQVATVQAPVSKAWTLQTVNFRPTVSTRYVTIRGVKTNVGNYSYSYTHVDNFSIAVGVGVEPETRAFSVEPHPNPFTTSLSLSLDERLVLPCQLTLCDMTGRFVHEQNASTTNLEIARGNMSAGMYLLTVRDAGGATAHRRIAVE